MSAHQALYPIATMCRVLEVSTSGYYAWRHRNPSARSKSDAALTVLIRKIHEWLRGTYGVPRMLKELIARGHHVNPKRVERLMREAGLQGVSRRKRTHTTRRDRGARVTPDLVARDFAAQGPDELWLADITYSAPSSWRHRGRCYQDLSMIDLRQARTKTAIGNLPHTFESGM